MIRLLSPLNHKGTIIDAGTVIGFLPPEQQEKLIKNGSAELINPDSKEKNVKTLDEMTKNELLEYAASLQIEGLSDKMTKAEILEAITATEQKSQE